MEKQKIFLLELNEFNLELLEYAAEALNLKHIQQILTFHKTEAYTDDTYDSDYLEPWVQWVSIHTGLPSSSHHIKHLGDVPDLATPQLWEKLHERGVTCGIWGAMNASCQESCNFFFPDPWTASEKAYPEELNALLYPLRNISKNYVKRPYAQMMRQLFTLFKLLFQNKIGGHVIKELPKLFGQISHFKGKDFPFILFLEYVATLLFLQYQKRYEPDFSLLFINSIAHLQHHHWKGSLSQPLECGFRNLDRILEKLFARQKPEDIFIIANALSQMNTTKEKPWILYRQKDHRKFLQTVGIPFKEVEAHMTHDAHLYFEDAQEKEYAKEMLESATIKNKKLFHVETYPQDSTKLFYRILFTDQVAEDEHFYLGEQSFLFSQLFTSIVQRTGKHIQQSTILCNHPLFPISMYNHELFHYILKMSEEPSVKFFAFNQR